MKKEAFPIYVTGGPESGYHPGMTLREYYAGQALGGLLMNDKRGGLPEEFAVDAVAYADALIAELEGGK